MTDHSMDHKPETEQRTNEERLADIMLTALSMHLEIIGNLRANEPTNMKEALTFLWLIGCMDAGTCLVKAANKGIDAGMDYFHEMQAELAEKIDHFLQLEEQ